MSHQTSNQRKRSLAPSEGLLAAALQRTKQLVRRGIPRWTTLGSFGEMRLLRVSYVVLILIPALHATCGWLNTWADNVAHVTEISLNSLREEMKSYRSGIVTTDPQEAVILKSLREWGEEDVTRADSLAQAVQIGLRVDLYIDSSRETAQSWLLLAETLDKWVELANRQTVYAGKPLIALPNRLRWLFLSMVLLSFGHFVYQAVCPPMLRLRHRPTRQGQATGLGDECDWKISALSTAGDDCSRISVVEDILLRWWTSSAKKEKNFPENFTDLVWESWGEMERFAPFRRMICSVCYFGGLLISGEWLTRQVIALFPKLT